MKSICFLTGMALGVCVGGMCVYKNAQLRKMMKEKEEAIMSKLDKARESVADYISPDEKATQPKTSKPQSASHVTTRAAAASENKVVAKKAK